MIPRYDNLHLRVLALNCLKDRLHSFLLLRIVRLEITGQGGKSL